jgi:hypothetical protein
MDEEPAHALARSVKDIAVPAQTGRCEISKNRTAQVRSTGSY